uniref:Uncharacterized protein n=1 Tax=Anopheles atroparvus TaxID=41427 RepID=A0A182ISH2_ANOAO
MDCLRCSVGSTWAACVSVIMVGASGATGWTTRCHSNVPFFSGRSLWKSKDHFLLFASLCSLILSSTYLREGEKWQNGINICNHQRREPAAHNYPAAQTVAQKITLVCFDRTHTKISVYSSLRGLKRIPVGDPPVLKKFVTN